MVTILAFLYSLWVIKTGTGDMKTFLLGIGLFIFGLLLYPFIMKSTLKVREKVKQPNHA
ncbi:hypothetical protein MGA3_07145 [Bacillus methanolicus MGA3]|nr:hypothetical protein MGA3_07145 [Bacillus methanolicus MGA3]